MRTPVALSAAIGAALSAAMLAAPAQAGVLFAFEETADGVFGTLSGSLDVTNAQSGVLGGAGATSIDPSRGSVFLVRDLAGLGQSIDSYLVTGPSAFGSGGGQDATDASGDAFAVGIADDLGEEVFLPDEYISGTELSGTLAFAGATFDSLGITPGTYVWELVPLEVPVLEPRTESVFVANAPASDNVITVTFTEAAVIPLPAGLPLLLAGLGGFALLRRTRG